MNIPHFVYPLISLWPSACFHFFALTNNAAVNVCVPGFVGMCSPLSWLYVQEWNAWVPVVSVSNCLGSCRTVLRVASRCYVPKSSVRGLQFLHILTHIVFVHLLLESPRWGWNGISGQFWSAFPQRPEMLWIVSCDRSFCRTPGIILEHSVEEEKPLNVFLFWK